MLTSASNHAKVYNTHTYTRCHNTLHMNTIINIHHTYTTPQYQPMYFRTYEANTIICTLINRLYLLPYVCTDATSYYKRHTIYNGLHTNTKLYKTHVPTQHTIHNTKLHTVLNILIPQHRQSHTTLHNTHMHMHRLHTNTNIRTCVHINTNAYLNTYT